MTDWGLRGIVGTSQMGHLECIELELATRLNVDYVMQVAPTLFHARICL